MQPQPFCIGTNAMTTAVVKSQDKNFKKLQSLRLKVFQFNRNKEDYIPSISHLLANAGVYDVVDHDHLIMIVTHLGKVLVFTRACRFMLAEGGLDCATFRKGRESYLSIGAIDKIDESYQIDGIQTLRFIGDMLYESDVRLYEETPDWAIALQDRALARYESSIYGSITAAFGI